MPASPSSSIALVTGAAKRLGRDIALALAREGFDLALHYGESKAEAEQTRTEILALGRRAITLQADLRQPCAADLLQRCVEALGVPAVLVNSASRFVFDTAADFSREALSEHLLVNATTPIELARALAARLGETEQAVVINLLDQKLFNPNPDFFSYTLSKACLLEATRLLALALAPKLRVVGIAPGITLPSHGQSHEAFVKAHSLAPLGRSSTPTDITQAVLFAVRCKGLTGSTLMIDGGQHLQRQSRDVMFL